MQISDLLLLFLFLLLLLFLFLLLLMLLLPLLLRRRSLHLLVLILGLGGGLPLLEVVLLPVPFLGVVGHGRSCHTMNVSIWPYGNTYVQGRRR